MNKTRVLLVDDHILLREGLAGIISAQPDLEVVGEAGDGLEAIVMAKELKPDLVLMDIQMPGLDGIEATRKIKQALPETIVVILTVRDDEERLFTALKNGAQGYLLKNMRSSMMLQMLREAIQGNIVIPPHLAGRMLDEFRRLSQMSSNKPIDDMDLSRREREILSLVSQGMADKEIAERLSISLYTVKSHLRNILAKLHVGSRREAAALAKDKGLL